MKLLFDLLPVAFFFAAYKLADIYVEGLVHITALHNDFYHFDPVGHRLNGERSGQVYRLGDPIRVKVAAVNLDDRKIDFVLDDEAVRPARVGRGLRRKKPPRVSKESTAESNKKRKGRKQDKAVAKKRGKKARKKKSR